MNAMTSGEGTSLLSRSYSPAPQQVEAIRLTAARAHDAQVVAGIGWVFGRIGLWFERRRASAELGQLTDRELADIGLQRSEIARVVGMLRR